MNASPERGILPLVPGLEPHIKRKPGAKPGSLWVILDSNQ